MSACIVESHGIRGKGESVEGVFMKCVAGWFRVDKDPVWEPASSHGFRCVGSGISALLEHLLGTLADLHFSQILLVGCQEPHMPEWILQRTGAVTVELILGF